MLGDDLINTELDIPCPGCMATAGSKCTDLLTGKKMDWVHIARRLSFAKQKKQFIFQASNMNEGQKAMTMYYAFVMLCDSCSQKSVDLFGKQLDSEEILMFFAKKAIEAMKEDGLV